MSDSLNQVLLVGRVPAEPEERVLPSGDTITVWRLVVPRPPSSARDRPTTRPGTVDTLDCVAWTAGTRRAAGRLAPGDLVRVEGRLQRRFWRTGAAVASRYEVCVESLRRLSRAG